MHFEAGRFLRGIPLPHIRQNIQVRKAVRLRHSRAPFCASCVPFPLLLGKALLLARRFPAPASIFRVSPKHRRECLLLRGQDGERGKFTGKNERRGMLQFYFRSRIRFRLACIASDSVR